MRRRDFYKLTLGLTPLGWLPSQEASKPVVIQVAVTDRNGRYVRGSNQRDFRVSEDGIPQRIVSVSRSDGGANPADGKETFESIRGDLENSYTITYYPDPTNQNGLSEIKIEIVPDVGGNWRYGTGLFIDPSSLRESRRFDQPG
jgi:hypothetical protein